MWDEIQTPGTWVASRARQPRDGRSPYLWLFVAVLAAVVVVNTLAVHAAYVLLRPPTPEGLEEARAARIRSAEAPRNFGMPFAGGGRYTSRVMHGELEPTEQLAAAYRDAVAVAADRAVWVADAAIAIAFGLLFPLVGYRFRDCLLMYLPAMAYFFIVKTAYRLAAPGPYWAADAPSETSAVPAPEP